MATKQKVKTFEFPPLNQVELIKSLTEEEILRVFELEKIRIADKEHNEKKENKKQNKWADAIKYGGDLERKIWHYVLKDVNPQSAPAKMMFYYFIKRLGKYIADGGKEVFSERVLDEMEKIKTLAHFATPLKVETTRAGVPAVVPDKSLDPIGAKKVEDLEMKYYEIVANITSIADSMLKELKKKATKKELKKLSVKELTTTIQKLVYTLSPLRNKKQQNNFLMNINLSNAKKEDFWRAFNKVQETFEDQ